MAYWNWNSRTLQTCSGLSIEITELPLPLELGVNFEWASGRLSFPSRFGCECDRTESRKQRFVLNKGRLDCFHTKQLQIFLNYYLSRNISQFDLNDVNPTPAGWTPFIPESGAVSLIPGPEFWAARSKMRNPSKSPRNGIGVPVPFIRQRGFLDNWRFSVAQCFRNCATGFNWLDFVVIEFGQ